jgi:hypothetical protein
VKYFFGWCQAPYVCATEKKRTDRLISLGGGSHFSLRFCCQDTHLFCTFYLVLRPLACVRRLSIYETHTRPNKMKNFLFSAIAAA